MCEEIKRSFDKADLRIVADIECFLVDSGITRAVPESIAAMYRGDLDKELLFVHLQMLPDAVKQYSETSGFLRSPLYTHCVML